MCVSFICLKICPRAAFSFRVRMDIYLLPCSPTSHWLQFTSQAADFSNQYICACLSVHASNGVESISGCQSFHIGFETESKMELQRAMHVHVHSFIRMCTGARKHLIKIHICITGFLSHLQTIKPLLPLCFHH